MKEICEQFDHSHRGVDDRLRELRRALLEEAKYVLCSLSDDDPLPEASVRKIPLDAPQRLKIHKHAREILDSFEKRLEDSTQADAQYVPPAFARSACERKSVEQKLRAAEDKIQRENLFTSSAASYPSRSKLFRENFDDSMPHPDGLDRDDVVIERLLQLGVPRQRIIDVGPRHYDALLAEIPGYQIALRERLEKSEYVL